MEINLCEVCGLEFRQHEEELAIPAIGSMHIGGVCLSRLKAELAAARAEVAEAKGQITNQQANNETRNRELDALHYVWCDGGCVGGVHRWQDNPPTEEVVTLAIRNTRRLAHWWDNHIMRTYPELTATRYQSHLEIEETVRDLQSQLDAARKREGELVRLVMASREALVDAHTEFYTLRMEYCHLTEVQSNFKRGWLVCHEAIEAIDKAIAAVHPEPGGGWGWGG